MATIDGDDIEWEVWETLDRQWPRRLLDIETMTSLERQAGNVYGNQREPKYSILSYTWGRWQIPGCCGLQVDGVTWQIPGLDESLAFTKAQFKQVLQKMGHQNRFAWVDVFCIDQEDYAVKMDEIGRQVGIFANADRVYCWLWTHETASLTTILRDLNGVYFNEVRDNRAPWDPSADQPSITGTYPQQLHPVTAERSQVLLPILRQLADCTASLLGDWWFSSLWTLQESALRTDAFILSRSGDLIRYPTPVESWYNIRTVSTTLKSIYIRLEDICVAYWDFESGRVGRAIIDIMRQSGLSVWGTCPNIQLSVARFRQATHELDRIYGVMSLYGLRVGSTNIHSDMAKVYTFEELEYEFVAAVNAHSPLLGQMFLHAERPRIGRTWQLNQRIRVPDDLAIYSAEYHSFDRCAIVASPYNPTVIKGRICPLDQLSSLWWATTVPHPLIGESDEGFYYNVMIDDYIPREHPSVPAFLNADLASGEQRMLWSSETVSALLEEFGNNAISVFELGECFVPGYREVFGLLLLHEKGCRQRSTRLGIARWVEEIKIVPWVLYEGEIY